ncbi:MAG: lipid-transfer protein [Hydrocarboniphaga sp.]|uniref:lipid-transfer protein n=1 Tax=Hydrocarboniphaga sp. TaxID=2033016 RepID=UPI002605AA52|nr:lipid-transfer protein [Hydrocarboniphaga sp.]MDB5967724.1 lipid-transfer protein [Hydrocarboniphaga sp.]
MSQKAYVAGVGMIPFLKPSAAEPYTVMGPKAIRLALADAGVDYSHIQQVYAGYVYGDSTCGQRVIYEVGMTGVPVINVNNNCATGSTALYLARQAIESGAFDCILAFGFEQMAPGALAAGFADRPPPMGKWVDQSQALQPAPTGTPPAPHLFGGAGVEYQQKYGTKNETFAKISEKARKHAFHNDKAIFRDLVTVEQVLATPTIYGVLTRLQCCPPTCGAAAAVLVSERFAKQHGLRTDIVILGQAMTTDYASTFEAGSMIKAVGSEMSKKAADAVYAQAGIGPEDIDVCELHDCFTANELLTYEALGFTPEGTAETFIWDGDNTYGGKVVTNPSGGLLSKGHPLGATGLAQCTELVEQLRGLCGPRQVEGARLALQHNIGIGGACVVTAYGRV